MNQAESFGLSQSSLDREEMKTQTFIGLGRDFVVHDSWATESEGQIYDRTSEHLGYTDKAIIKARQLLLRAIERMQGGGDPPHVIRDPARNNLSHLISIQEVVPNSVDWRNHWRTRVAEQAAMLPAR